MKNIIGDTEKCLMSKDFGNLLCRIIIILHIKFTRNVFMKSVLYFSHLQIFLYFSIGSL